MHAVFAAEFVATLAAEDEGGYNWAAMHALKAVMKNGRLVMDEPTEPPEGTELVLSVLDDGDDMDDAECVRLHESL